jgi:putative sterol carrier protein
VFAERGSALRPRRQKESSMDLQHVLNGMVSQFNPEAAKGVAAEIQMDLTGEGGGLYCVQIKDGKASLTTGKVEKPTATLKLAAKDWIDISTGKLDPMTAFMMGKIKIEGDMGLMMRFQGFFKR